MKKNPRIITGSAKNQRLEVPERGTRPMTDRVKSALFSMIQDFIPEALVLDLFAGTGALGIECLSRGSKKCIFIDRSKDAVRVINQNLEKTKLASKARVVKCSAVRFLNEFETFKTETKAFDIIFFAPPYKNFREKVLEKTAKLIKKDGVIVVEHAKTRKVEKHIGSLEMVEEREYGITGLSFFRLANS
jgi:16S rRNA (guanine966-N2)-methyltransferase